jgi:iron complex transport system permease protein
MNRVRQNALFVLIALALLVLLCTPFVGLTTIPLPAVFDGTGDYAVAHGLFWTYRAPRVIGAFLIGGTLSLAGLCFQALFRNPLATPFTLGVSGGAALGAAVALRFAVGSALLAMSAPTVAAFIGALLSILLVYSLGRLKGDLSGTTMLLAGVAVSFFFSSLILLIQYLSDSVSSHRIVRWLMGEIPANGFQPVWVMLPFAVLTLGVALRVPGELNLLAVDEELAASRGVDVDRTRKLIFFAVSIGVGATVAMAGPIGFVGMICPHICRLLVGHNHRRLIPAAWLFGGTFLALCNTLAFRLIAPVGLPVGVVTALLGGPFFLWLLFGRKIQ